MAEKAKRLLTTKDRAQCKKIAETDKGLMGKRAAALLALDQGMSQVAAARHVRITLGQVKYAVALLRQNKLFVSAEEIVPETSTDAGKPPIKSQPKEKKQMAKDKKEKKKEKAKKKEKVEKKLKKAKKADDKKKKSKKKEKAKAVKKAPKKSKKKTEKKKKTKKKK